MRIVVLMSGGLDSAVAAVLARSEGLDVHPVFVDYGQRAARRELAACRKLCKQHGFEAPCVIRLPGFGRAVQSGLTSTTLDLVRDAFLPGRNLLLLVAGAAHAYQVDASAIAIGLLSEERALFPDQTHRFVVAAERAINEATGRHIRVIAPLSSFQKRDVVALAAKFGIGTTYSCHAGGTKACGRCIACREYL